MMIGIKKLIELEKVVLNITVKTEAGGLKKQVLYAYQHKDSFYIAKQPHSIDYRSKIRINLQNCKYTLLKIPNGLIQWSKKVFLLNRKELQAVVEFQFYNYFLKI